MTVFLESLALTSKLADYIYLLFQWHLRQNTSAPYPACPAGLSCELRAECGEYASEAAFAYRNPGK